MNALQLVNAVLSYVDWPSGDLATITEDIMGSRVLGMVNTAIEAVFHANVAWTWLKTRFSVTLVAGTDTYTLPALDTDSIQTVNLASSGQPLTYVSFWEWENAKPDITSASSATNPAIYTILNDEISVYPTPTSADTLNIIANALPDVLVADADTTIIPTKYHNGLVQIALTYAKVYLGDPDINAQFALREKQIKAMLANNSRFMQGPMGMTPDRRFHRRS